MEPSDIIDLTENTCSLIHNLISSNTMKFIEPSFDTWLKDELYGILSIQLDLVCDNKDDYINIVIENAYSIYFNSICPKRSYFDTDIYFNTDKNLIKDKLHYLKNIPQPTQKTNEWYEFRYKFLTASSIWKAFSTPGNVNNLIYSKCKPLDVSKYKSFNLESPMHWGHKYEDVSIQWYEREYKTKVAEFGCIPHRTIQYLAASPDGINVDPSSNLYGRMVEVKNIVNREITGIPKLEYWVQMQIQMQVCDLNECDFLETRFYEYDDEEDFLNDGTFNMSSKQKHKGVFALFLDKDNQPIYEYPPFKISQSEYNIWREEIMIKHSDKQWLKNIYWRLDEISVVLVLKNDIWFNTAKPILDKLWDTILHEKHNGYEHRKPSSKQKNIKISSSSIKVIKKNEIVLNIDTSGC